jgi:glycosyltransferase involved in cell wall biosynthesis
MNDDTIKQAAFPNEAPIGTRGGATFVFVGTLDYRGRLLKEIKTLQNAGFECRLVLGNIGEREVDGSRYDFEIKEYRVPCFRGKIRYFFEQLRFAWRAGRKIATSDAEVVFCLALDGVLAGVVARWLRPSLRLIFDSNELHLESFNSRIKRAVWRPLQALAVKSCDAIVHAESNRMAYFKEVHGGRSIPQMVIENFPHYQAGFARVANDSGPLKVIYLGALGDDRYTHELIDAGRSMADLIELDFVGFATPEVMADLERRYGPAPAPNIRILPPVAYDEIPSLLKNYHIGIALYKNTNLNNYYCAPNKVYDYLMSGMAVIANDYPGLRKVLEDRRLGACLTEVTPASFENAVNRILREKRWQNITDDVRRSYSWEQQEQKLLALFREKASDEESNFKLIG